MLIATAVQERNFFPLCGGELTNIYRMTQTMSLGSQRNSAKSIHMACLCERITSMTCMVNDTGCLSSAEFFLTINGLAFEVMSLHTSWGKKSGNNYRVNLNKK